MADTQNFVVSMPSSLFTAARSFKALAKGKIYLGQPDTDPTIPSNQIQVYVSNEDGTLVPVPQPLIINAGGHPVYSGQIVKFVTLQSHSMAIYDAYGSLEYYFHDVSQYDASYFIAYATENFEPAKYKRIAGSFSIGATITNKMDVLIYGGDYYQWTGALPKTVAAGSTPTESGWKLVGPALESRRADRYDSIQEVLNTGMDVTIGEDAAVAQTVIVKKDQMVNGSGGRAMADSGVTTGFTVNADNFPSDNVYFDSLKSTGSITSSGVPGYGITSVRTSNLSVSNAYFEGYTGGVELVQTTSARINGIRVPTSVYHPTLTAGGYGVLLENSIGTLVSGLQFNASSGNQGRHALYISRLDRTDGGYDGCQNTVVTGIYAKYENKDNRDFPSMVLRKSDRSSIHDFVVDGANGGIGYNVQNGNILNNVVGNGVMNILKYSDTLAVRAFGQGISGSYTCNRFVYHDMVIEVMPKLQDGSITYDNCIAFDVQGSNGIITSCVTKVARSGRPFIFASASNVLISNIMDVIDDSATTAISPMFSFNSASSNIAIKNIVTQRAMFSGLDNVTDMTVDFVRKATVRCVSGVITVTDANSLISSTSSDANNVTVVLKGHVTQAAVNSATVLTTGTYLPPQTSIILTRSSKTLVVRMYNSSGAIVSPATSNLEFEIILVS